MLFDFGLLGLSIDLCTVAMQNSIEDEMTDANTVVGRLRVGEEMSEIVSGLSILLLSKLK
jgi:hypothetical protein